MSLAKFPDQNSIISVLITTVTQMPHVVILWMLLHVAAMKDTRVMVCPAKHFQFKTSVHWEATIAMMMLAVLIHNTVTSALVILEPKITHLTPTTFLAENAKAWAAVEYGKSTGMIHGFSNALIIQIKLVVLVVGCTTVLKFHHMLCLMLHWGERTVGALLIGILMAEIVFHITHMQPTRDLIQDSHAWVIMYNGQVAINQPA